MLRNYRVIHNDAGTLKDLSAKLSDPRAGASVIEIASGDFLYLGSELPFNHRYFLVSDPNDQAATPTVEFWTGSSWVPAVDLRDETANAAGIPLAQSGVFSWAMDEQKSSWTDDDTEQMNNSGLETLLIYGLYWARLSYSASLKATLAINYIGHKFCREADLTAEYPELARATMKTAWAAGKTTWDDQILVASEYIVQELVKRNVMQTADQIIAIVSTKGALSEAQKAQIRAAAQPKQEARPEVIDAPEQKAQADDDGWLEDYESTEAQQ